MDGNINIQIKTNINLKMRVNNMTKMNSIIMILIEMVLIFKYRCGSFLISNRNEMNIKNIRETYSRSSQVFPECNIS